MFGKLATLTFVDLLEQTPNHHRRGSKYRLKGGYTGESIRLFNSYNGVGSRKRRLKFMKEASR